MISCAGDVFDDLSYDAALRQTRMSVGGRSPDAHCDRLGLPEKLRFGDEASKAGEQLILRVDMLRNRRTETLAVLSRRLLLEIPEPLLELALGPAQILHDGLAVLTFPHVIPDRRVEKVPLDAQVLGDLENPGRSVEQVSVIRRQKIEQIQVGHPSTLDSGAAVSPP